MAQRLQAPLFGAGPMLNIDLDDDFEDFLIPDPGSFSAISTLAHRGVSSQQFTSVSDNASDRVLPPSPFAEFGIEIQKENNAATASSASLQRTEAVIQPSPSEPSSEAAGMPGRSRRSTAKAASARISAAIEADKSQPPLKKARFASEPARVVAAPLHAPAPSSAHAKPGKSTSIAASAPVAGLSDIDDSEDDDDLDELDEDDDDEDGDGVGSKRKRRPGDPDKRLARSRERNRVHARKSRLRKKFFVDSMKRNLEQLEDENRQLRAFLEAKSGCTYEQLQADEAAGHTLPGSHAVTTALSSVSKSLLAGPGQQPSAMLEGGDYALVEALTNSQQNFVISDPTMPDNPIVFASAGFYELTGFSPQEVIGRNCRFLQGPRTDADAISAIRTSIAAGLDCAVCIINYKKDGTPFWNRFFVAPLRGVDGKIVNFVGVQCEVKANVANALINVQGGVHIEYTPAPADAVATGSSARTTGASASGASSSGDKSRRH